MTPRPASKHGAIRKAEPADADAMAVLHGRCFDSGWEAVVIRAFIESPSFLCRLYQTEDRIEDASLAGLIICQVVQDEAELITFAVAPEKRRAGIGRSLFQAVCSEARAKGAKRLFLDVDEANMPALALYRSLGAVPVGRRPAYYANGADAAVFSLTL